MARDSQVGPGVSVGDGCRISGSTLEDTIVMDGAVVEGVHLRNSIVGRNAFVRSRGGHVFDGLLLGDEGRVELV
jgi:glucose-1-phosphate thymidylyltransferase